MARILVHGSQVSFGYFLREFIKHANEKGANQEWSLILYSNTGDLLDSFNELLSPGNVFYLQPSLNEYMKNTNIDLEELRDFPASIFECIATSKEVAGHISLLGKSRDYQLKLVIGTYKAYKEFMLQIKPDFVLFPCLEVYDSYILYSICKELGVTPVVYEHARSLGVSFFTDSLYQGLPSYTSKLKPSEDCLRKARDFIYQFRKKPHSPSLLFNRAYPNDNPIIIPYLRRSFLKRCLDYIKKIASIHFFGAKAEFYEPYLADKYTLVHILRINLFWLTKRYRMLKEKMHALFYDIHSLEQLPKKFIYFPLQYSPESSINIPAPFFVDQLRALDLVLNFMPADYYLVVKDHPAMRGMRPVYFYKELKKRGSVRLADVSLSSIDLIQKSALTISITGTACLEAFLLGKPSMHLNRAFFSDWIYRFDSITHFRALLKEAVRVSEVPLEKITDFVASVFLLGGNFILFSPADPHLDAEFVLNRENIEAFLDAFLKHIARYSL